jgi:hypothetical protein
VCCCDIVVVIPSFIKLVQVVTGRLRTNTLLLLLLLLLLLTIFLILSLICWLIELYCIFCLAFHYFYLSCVLLLH